MALPGRPERGTEGPGEHAETAAVVQDEVDRLAAKYRDPVVLCFYEGHSHAEAAARLGWPVGTVASRLARAKDRLRDRLTRRGVALSAVVLTAARADAGLIRNTLTTVLGPAGRVPPGVLTLTNGVVSAMKVAKLKLFAAGSASALVLTAGVFAVHGGHGPGGGGDGPGGRSGGRAESPGPLAHLRALHDHLYRWWHGVSADNPDAAAEKELKALAGEWRAVAASISGVDDPAEVVKTISWTITPDGHVTMAEGGQAGKARLAVDPAKTPPHVTLTLADGPEKGRALDGVYRLKGDKLVVALADPKTEGAGRPKEVKPGKGVAYIELERVKDAKEELAALAGEWRFTGLSHSGKAAPAAEVEKMRWFVAEEGGAVAISDGPGRPVEGAQLAVVPGEAPARVTLTPTTGLEKGHALHGIYSRQGDKLYLAFADPNVDGAARPKELKPGKGVAYIELERVKGAKTELAALAGEWQVKSLTSGGRELPADEVAKQSWAITKDGEVEMKEVDGRPTTKLALKLDPSQTPPHATMTITDGPEPERGNVLDGVYARDGDKLAVAFADPKVKDSARPKAVKAADGVVYITLERRK